MTANCTGERVLLVHPGIYDDFRDRSYPPWGIISVGTACRAAGAEVFLADLNGECVSGRMEELIKLHRPTVIGITAKLGNGAARMRTAIETARSLTNVPLGLGGPLVSTFSEADHEIWEGASAIFRGDGECLFPQWIASGCTTSGLVGPKPVHSLDTVGIPSWWEGLGEYVSDGEWWPGLEVRSIHVSAARGCTRRCTFCYLHSQFADRGIRVVSPRRILEGCDALNAKWNARGFFFVDDCFVRPGHPELDEFLRLLERRGSPYRFGCDLQIQELEDRTLLQSMYRAGFRALYIGVESASSTVRRRLGKGAVSTPLAELLQRALDMGFVIRASIGIGWPEETEVEMRSTLELIREIPDLMFDAFRYTPLPGVPLTRFWARTSPSLQEPLSPFEDYSEYSENYSSLDDRTMEKVWKEMRQLEQARHEKYFKPAQSMAIC